MEGAVPFPVYFLAQRSARGEVCPSALLSFIFEPAVVGTHGGTASACAKALNPAPERAKFSPVSSPLIPFKHTQCSSPTKRFQRGLVCQRQFTNKLIFGCLSGQGGAVTFITTARATPANSDPRFTTADCLDPRSSPPCKASSRSRGHARQPQGR